MEVLSSIGAASPLVPPSGRSPCAILQIFASRVLSSTLRVEKTQGDTVGGGEGLEGMVNRQVTNQDGPTCL